MNKRVLSFNYTLRNTKGQVIDASQGNPLVFLEGAQQIIPALEAKLIFMTVGDKLNVKLKAEDAYGLPQENMVMQVPRADLAHLQLELGGFLQLQLERQVKVVRITEITDQNVTLDGNHPLAGEDLDFDIELVSTREATAEELSHGHAHGPGGHHH